MPRQLFRCRKVERNNKYPLIQSLACCGKIKQMLCKEDKLVLTCRRLHFIAITPKLCIYLAKLITAKLVGYSQYAGGNARITSLLNILFVCDLAETHEINPLAFCQAHGLNLFTFQNQPNELFPDRVHYIFPHIYAPEVATPMDTFWRYMHPPLACLGRACVVGATISHQLHFCSVRRTLGSMRVNCKLLCWRKVSSRTSSS